jgi:NADP-dependent 3-hydroxy acid dehydrogenase YdfG
VPAIARIQEFARELSARGSKAIATMTDVTDREQVKKLADAAVQAYGPAQLTSN